MTMLMFLMNCVDIFSIPIQLNYKSQFFFKSAIGFITSLAILGMMTTMTILLLKGLFEHNQVIVVSKTAFSVNPEDFKLSPTNFQIAVTLQDKFNGFILNNPNKKYFDIKIDFLWLKSEQTNGKLNQSFIINPGTVRQCTSDDAIDGVDSIIMPNFYCLDKKSFENQSVALGGMFSQDHVRTVRVQVLKCINRPDCAPFKEVEAKLIGAKVSLGFYDSFLDLTSYGSPLKRVMRIKQLGLDVDQITRTIMWMKKVQVQSDENFFLFNNKRNIEQGLQFSSYENNYNSQLNNSLSMPSIRDFNFEIEQNEEFTYRSYGNILEVMAYIGGFYRFLTFIASLFINPWVKKHYMTQVAEEVNKIYDQTGKQLQPYIQSKTSKIQNQIKISLMERIKNFTSQNKMNCLVQQNDILKCMDVMRIIQISQDIQRLKTILLTKEQRILLDLIPVPLNFEKEKNSNDNEQLEESIKFVQSFENLINCNIKQQLFKDQQELPSSLEIPDIGKRYSIIPDELKSSRAIQDYKLNINSKFTERQNYQR